jgi:hypothetical protein
LRFVTRSGLQEAALVALLFASTAVWGTVYWNRSLQAGRQPEFYQSYFEPAVMMACGRGFVLAHPPVPAVADFLARKTDRLPCDAIPQSAGLSDYGVYQRIWLYLMLTVALTWKVLGVSWSGMGPLFGGLFGATIVSAYGVFRVGMGRVVSLLGAAALSVSAIHLQNLPHLRDYAKAPMTIALIGLLFAMVVKPPSWRRLLTVAGAYGLVLGVGYGFRTDFLALIPVFFVVLFAFVPGGWLRNLSAKCAAAVLCLAVFTASAWPVIATVRRGGGCQWHTVLLGLSDRPFNDSLMIAPGPYSFGHAYSDSLVYAMTTGFARRVQPDVGYINYCSPQYDAATGRYLATLAGTFPADVVTRTVASIEQVVQTPFRWADTPLPGFAAWFYKLRFLLLRPLRGTGILFVGLALASLTAADLRLGLFGLFVVSYFGGYPMLQFDVRHYFHLEMLTWWAIGFVVQQVVIRARRDGIRGVWRTGPDQRPQLNWRRAAVTLMAVVAGAASVSWVVRSYQQRVVARLFHAYAEAPKEQVRLGPIVSGVFYPVSIEHPPDSYPYPVDVIEVEADAAACGPRAVATFRYREKEIEFTHTVAIAAGHEAGTTRVFEPVYARFEGVEFADAGPGCVTSVFRLSDPDRLPVLLSATLAAGWERDALYQRRRDWQWTLR